MSSWDRELLTSCCWVVAVEAVAFVAGRLGRVREPGAVLERPRDPVERIPHLLPRQLGLLGPEHLRALPGPGRARDGALLWARERRTLALLTALIAVALVRAAVHLLAVELRRAAGRPGRARGAEVELALDPPLSAPCGCWRVRRALAGGVSKLTSPAQHRHRRQGQPRLRRPPPLRPSPRLRLRLGRLPQGLPGTHRHRQGSRSPSPTRNQSLSPPSRASSASPLRGAARIALWTMASGMVPAQARADRSCRRAAVLAAFVALSSTRWPTPASSRTRSPGCCWRLASR